MKRLLIAGSIILILITSIYVALFAHDKQSAQKTYVQPYYIALGDSLAAGMGVPANMGYADNYYNHLRSIDPHTKYLNLGHGGDTTEDLLLTLSKNKSELKKATIISIDIGINDIFERLRQLETQVSPDEINDTYNKVNVNYQKILPLLKSTAPQAKIIVLNYYNPFVNDTWFEGHINKLNKIISNSTKTNSVFLIDIHQLFAGSGLKYLMKENYQQDPIHPNIEGYKLIGQAFKTIEIQ